MSRCSVAHTIRIIIVALSYEETNSITVRVI